jgi:hypothetical protein
MDDIEHGATYHEDASWITAGYALNHENIRKGVNLCTGMSYLEYEEIRLLESAFIIVIIL